MHLAQGVIATNCTNIQKLIHGIVLHRTLCSSRHAKTMLLTHASHGTGITPKSWNTEQGELSVFVCHYVELQTVLALQHRRWKNPMAGALSGSFLKLILFKTRRYGFGKGICPPEMCQGYKHKVGQETIGFWWWCWRGQWETSVLTAVRTACIVFMVSAVGKLMI